MLEIITAVNDVLNGFIWGVPAMTCIIGVGLYLAVRTGFLQVRKFGYAKKDGVVEEGADGDRVYENIVNEAYMSECEEIEFEISSYNADGATYSKALLGGGFLTNNLYC